MDPLKEALSKSFYREHNGGKHYNFYCPLCRAQRRISLQPKPQPRHYAQIGLTAAFFTLITWPLFSWMGIVSFLPMWLVFETLYRAKVRGAVTCSACGFDPFLYMNDKGRARKEVEAHWRKKFAEKGIPYPEKKGAESEQQSAPVGAEDEANLEADAPHSP